MVEYVFLHSYFITYFTVGDNYSTIQTVLKHTSRGSQGQVLNSSKGKLDDEIPVPSLLAYPSHRVKVVYRHIFFISNNGKAHRCG